MSTKVNMNFFGKNGNLNKSGNQNKSNNQNKNGIVRMNISNCRYIMGNVMYTKPKGCGCGG